MKGECEIRWKYYKYVDFALDHFDKGIKEANALSTQQEKDSWWPAWHSDTAAEIFPA